QILDYVQFTRRSDTDKSMSVASQNRDHWAVESNFRPNWSKRAARAAVFIKPGSVVCDIGCGPTMVLQQYLPKGCSYLPCDMKAWNETIEVCDINIEVLPAKSLAQCDIAVLLGVLEYLDDPARTLSALSTHAEAIVFSYHPREYGPPRTALWRNSLSYRDVTEMVQKAGYTRLDRLYFSSKQTIFRASHGSCGPSFPYMLRWLNLRSRWRQYRIVRKTWRWGLERIGFQKLYNQNPETMYGLT